MGMFFLFSFLFFFSIFFQRAETVDGLVLAVATTGAVAVVEVESKKKANE